MADARHKRKYPKGDRKEMTPAWKQLVLDKLADNKSKGLHPADKSELADALKVHKSSFTGFFKPETTTSKLVPRICALLGIEPPLQAPSTDDELSKFVGGLDGDARRRALAILRAAMTDD